MGIREDLTSLCAAFAEIHDLHAASSLLSWDQETCMPQKGLAGRAPALAALAGLCHEKLCAPRVGDLLERLAERTAAEDLSAEEAALVREARRDHERASKVPAAIVREVAEASSKALVAWQQARAASRFQDFAPHLSRLVSLKKRTAEALGYAETPYDALLDEFEPGVTTSFLQRLFLELRAELKPFVQEVLAARKVDAEPVRRRYEPARQIAFATEVARSMGFDFEAGRIDRAAHPFCSGIHRGDVRLTWRSSDDDLRPALFGVIHEAGHGLYEQGLPEAWARTPLGEASSYGIHESQSRLWENLVGRGRAFWKHFLPRLQDFFPGVAADLDVEAMYRAVNEVTPSFIRTEADELTYNLHIVLRFEIERDLFAGKLALEDLPEAWNNGTEALLGIRPGNDAQGLLQDIHWSMGSFGYFPSYTLGNLYAAQLFDAALSDIPDLEARIAQGDLLPLREWLREKVHARGRLLQARDLIRDVTGREPGMEAFLAQVRRKFGEIYGV
ncbi:MAG: carboxypeptidase M32 [Planctomycetes bacterium]|nr:carboxypeptidase M32 [Planctomycetota bacterium]